MKYLIFFVISLLLSSCVQQSIATRLVAIKANKELPYEVVQDNAHIRSFLYNGVKVNLDTGYYFTSPPMFEVLVSLETNKDCKSCSFDRIEVIDLNRNIKLQRLPIEIVANILFPIRPYATYKPVPAPDLVGVNGASKTYGHYSDPNFYSTSNINVTPVYDYTTQNQVVMQNIGTTVYNNNVQAMNNAHNYIILYTGGDISLGKLPESAKRSGSIFFAIPPQSVGPYQVRVLLNKTKHIKADFGFGIN